MNYKLITVTAFSQNCSLVWCPETQEAALIDPGGEAEKIRQAVKEHPVSIKTILLTHGHLDHVGAAKELAHYYDVPVKGPQEQDRFWLNNLPEQSRMFGLPQQAAFTPDCWLNEGERLYVGKAMLEVLHCPGHTPGHVAFFHRRGRLLISGDILFDGGVGRSDFPQGDHNQLIASIKEKLLPLGDDVTFIPGHGPLSTLGKQRISNPFLQ